MVFVLVLCITAGTMFCGAGLEGTGPEAFAMDGPMDEEVAVGLYDQDYEEYDRQYEVRNAEPRLEVKSANFAQALTQDYRGVTGTLRLTESSRFFVVLVGGIADEETLKSVRLMADLFSEYGVPSEKPLEVVTGPVEEAQDGDIVIELTGSGPLGKKIRSYLGEVSLDEAYELDIEDRFEISGCTADGLYYGMLTLLEMAAGRNSKNGSITLERCRISDAPDLKERTIFIDCARKYFSAEWLKKFIRRSSIQRYNTIVLHFSEAECIRLDSDVFPWLTEGVKSLSRDEMKDIVETAHKYHMDVIPSIDTPGHNMYMVRKYEEYSSKHKDFSFEYGGKTYDRGTKGFKSVSNHYSRDGVTRKVADIGIDITKEHAVAFSNALIDDYAEFFRSLGCSRFDVCGDEIMGWSNFMLGENQVSYKDRWLFLEHWKKYARKELGIRKGSASDTFISYINDVTGRLEEMGYTCRVFNDEIDINKDQHVELNESVDIVCWDMAANNAEHFAEKGHTVHNGVMQWTYYVIRKIGGKDIMKGRYKTVNARNIYENWDPRSFSPAAGADRKVDEGHFGGGYFFIWCDAPEYKSAKTVMEETDLRMWANSCRMWNPEVNSGKSGIRAAMNYKQFKAFADRMGQM